MTTTPEVIRPNIGTGVAYKWTLAAGETGNACVEFNHADRSVQIEGAFGGATVVVEGTNDGTTYYTLNDNQALPLSFTVGGVLKAITECTMQIRARVSGGDGTTAVVVTIFGRKNQQ